MNELSWLIYLADVAGSVKGASGFVAGAMVPATIAMSIVDLSKYRSNTHRADVEVWDKAMAEHVQYPRLYKKPSTDRPKDEDAPMWRPWPAIKGPVLTLFAAAVLFCAFPASGTLYAIAASEMGERVIQSETGDKAIQALNAWLDRQIAGKPDA